MDWIKTAMGFSLKYETIKQFDIAVKSDNMWQRSQNYVWSTEHLLGKGAFGCVYKGANKATGESVAVKTFQTSNDFSQDVEFDILKRVNHENVIKLIAFEENRKQHKVIIMELCTGGSLYDVIDHPENQYGLDENEFLIVLNHITDGMRYLRANQLIHRDLKPGNIMRFQSDDGKIIYKIGDFGAARELHDDQQFQSFYGTEEYLRPDLYEAALVRYSKNRFFGPTIDLWSIGVTLYHVATGELPFQAYGGRRNRRQMFQIMSTKPSGVISGIQRTKNGEIHYTKNLPNNCQLSFSLKVLITTILSGLLEADLRKSWNFDKYFDAVDDILSRKIINVFWMNQARIIKIYLHPNEDYQNFQNYIHEQTGILSRNQAFLFHSNLIVQLDNTIETTEEDPLFLFDRNNNEITASLYDNLPIINGFSEQILLCVDTQRAKKACSIGYICKRHIEKYSLISKHFTNTVINFNQFIINELKELKQTLKFLFEKGEIIKKILPIILAYQEHLSNISFIDHLNKYDKNFRLDIFNKITQLNQDCVENYLENEWVWDGATIRVNTLVEHLTSSWKMLKSLKDQDELSYGDRNSYKLERIKIENTLKKTINILEEVYQQYVNLTGKFNERYQIARDALSNLLIIKRNVIKFRDVLEQTDATIKNENYLGKLQSFLQTKLASNRNRNKRNNYERLKQLLENYNSKNDQLGELLKRNSSLNDEISGISRTIDFLLEIQLEHDTTTASYETENNQNTQEILNENSILSPEIDDIIRQIDSNFSTLCDI